MLAGAQVLLQVASLGAAYALLVLGFVLILNATGSVNFSQGDLVMAGGFVAALLGNLWHIPSLVMLPLLLAIMGGLGVVVAALAYMPLRARPPEAVFISTIAVGVILQQAANRLFGAEPMAAPPLLGDGRVQFAGVSASVQSLTIVGVAILLIGAVYGLFAHTQLGRRLRATAQDRQMAMAIGIPVHAMVLGTFAVGGALAGAAGLLLANVFFVTPTVGSDYILKAYIAVVIGGWGSVRGAVAGALLIAVFEVLFPSLPLLIPALASWPSADLLFSQTAATIVLDVIVLVILFARPQGLFGEVVGQRP